MEQNQLVIAVLSFLSGALSAVLGSYIVVSSRRCERRRQLRKILLSN